jgi:hypothetical protein
MARAVLLVGAMSLAGCIVPETLTTDTPPQASTPVILADTTPHFGYLTLSMSSALEVDAVASDPNVDDTLRARLFNQRAGMGPLGFIEEQVMFADPSDPMHFRRKVPFTPRQFCTNFPDGDLIWLVVTNSLFKESTDDTQSCCKDAKQWTLVCQ